MAKQQRMAVMTFACVGSAVLAATQWSGELMRLALVVVAIGCNITIARRTLRIIAELEAK